MASAAHQPWTDENNPDYMKVAAAQISCALGDSTANLAKIREFCARAEKAGAELIVFPEMSDTGYAMAAIRKHAAPWKEGAVPELQEIARTISIAIVSGVSEREGDNIYNTQIALDEKGSIIAKYRKSHLFATAPIDEHTCCSPGDALTSFAWGAWQFGLSICYDLRFPEVYRTLALETRSNAFLVSSAWPFPRVEHLRILASARAIENQSYLVIANRVGTDAGVTFCGASAIIDPYGVCVAASSTDREELICADFSTEVLQSVRDGMPVLTHRRPELYAKC